MLLVDEFVDFGYGNVRSAQEPIIHALPIPPPPALYL
jgi:hypothetical protein